MHVQRLTHVRGRSFPCCGLFGLNLAIWAPWHIHPHARQFLPRACKRSCLRPATVSPLPSFCPSKTASEHPAKMLLAAFKKKGKNRCNGGTGTERGGSPTTRAFDNPKTAADRKHERLQACRRQLHGRNIGFPRTSARVLAIGIAQVRSWREGGSARWRSLQRLQLRCRVFCKLYCRGVYSTLRESSIAAQEVRPCPDICMCFASAQLQRKRSSD